MAVGGVLSYIIIAYGAAALLYFRLLGRRSFLGFGLFCGALHVLMVGLVAAMAAFSDNPEACDLFMFFVVFDLPISILYWFADQYLPAPPWVADASDWVNVYLPAAFFGIAGSLQAFGIGWALPHVWQAARRRLGASPAADAARDEQGASGG